MSPETLTSYLHRSIPLTAAMKVSVVSASRESVKIDMPLEPNRNHHATAFGGSLSAGLTLAGWAMMRVRMGESGLLDQDALHLSTPFPQTAQLPDHSVRLVVSRSSTEYLNPVDADFRVECGFADEVLWQRFVTRFESNHWAKLRLQSSVTCSGQVSARQKATFVAVRGEGPAGELREMS